MPAKASSWKGRSGVTTSRRGHRGQRTTPQSSAVAVRERQRCADVAKRMRAADEAEACAAIDAAVERANAKLEQLIDPAEVAALGRTRR